MNNRIQRQRLRRAVTAIAASSAVVMAGLIGCGSSRRDAPYTEPLVTDDPAIRRGQMVFAAHCYQCHPGGAGGLGPAINDKPLPVRAIKMQVRTGLGAMPAFSEEQISDADLETIPKYLKALRSLRG